MHYMSSTLKSSRKLTRSSALALRLVRVQFVRVRVPGASLTTGRQLSAPLNTKCAFADIVPEGIARVACVTVKPFTVPLATSCGEVYAYPAKVSCRNGIIDYRRLRWPFEFPKETREPSKARASRDAGNGIARILCTEFTPGHCREVNSTQSRSRSHSASDFSRARVSCCKSASYALVTSSYKESDFVGTVRHFWTASSLRGYCQRGSYPSSVYIPL